MHDGCGSADITGFGDDLFEVNRPECNPLLGLYQAMDRRTTASTLTARLQTAGNCLCELVALETLHEERPERRGAIHNRYRPECDTRNSRPSLPGTQRPWSVSSPQPLKQMILPPKAGPKQTHYETQDSFVDGKIG